MKSRTDLTRPSFLAFLVFLLSASGTYPASAGVEPIIDGKALSEWKNELQNKDVAKRLEAIKVIHLAPPIYDRAKFVPALVKCLEDDDPDVRFYAIVTLRNYGPAARDATLALVPFLNDPKSLVREITAKALERIGNKDPLIVKALQKTLVDPDLLVRINAAQAHATLSGDGKAAVDVLRPLISHPQEKLRHQAVYALAIVGACTETDGVAVTPSLFD